MKKLEAIIQLSKLNDVQDALAEIGIDVMTVCEVKGFGRQHQHKETYRSKDYTINYLPMIKIDLVVDDPMVEPAMNIFVQSAKTARTGGGRILVSEVKETSFAM